MKRLPSMAKLQHHSFAYLTFNLIATDSVIEKYHGNYGVHTHWHDDEAHAKIDFERIKNEEACDDDDDDIQNIHDVSFNVKENATNVLIFIIEHACS